MAAAAGGKREEAISHATFTKLFSFCTWQPSKVAPSFFTSLVAGAGTQDQINLAEKKLELRLAEMR